MPTMIEIIEILVGNHMMYIEHSKITKLNIQLQQISHKPDN